jgi:hypothetical protein
LVPALRERFNREWRPELYAELLRSVRTGFRCCETPVFLPRPLLDKMARYGRELYEQLAANPEYRTASEQAIPPQFRVSNESEHPLFVQADFGLVREADGGLEPKLVEIQGFPSLYGFQIDLAKEYQRVYGLGGTPFLGGLDEHGYIELLRRAILNEHAPEEVILLEIEPYQQKTLQDFLITQRMLGIRIACITNVQKQGRKLYFEGIPVKRIYNRVIVDELVRKGTRAGFQFTDDLDVEWAGHPNWFFRLSKFSLPWFRHVSVPETRFLSDVHPLPENLENYVLKPLYSFAGLGVKIGPAREEIEAIPEPERGNFILQRKVDFAATIDTPSGMTKAEIRIMFIRDGGELKPVTTVIRMGRGKMMGVDFNRDLDWVGASAGLLF